MLGRINSRLSIGARLALVSGLFVTASAVGAGLLAQRGMNEIAFSEKERSGSEQINRIWRAMQENGTAAIPGHERADALFNAATAASAYFEADSALERDSAGAAYIVAVADGSNLTLDPDLDSFYAMDAAVVRLPSLRLEAQGLVEAMALPLVQADRQVRIAVALDRVERATQAAQASLDASMANNAAGDVRGALQNPTQALAATTQALIARGRAALTGQAVDASGAHRAFEDQLNTTWVASNGALARLLDARIARMQTGLARDMAIVLALLGFAAFLAWLIARGLGQRFNALGATMDRLTNGDKSVDVPHLDDRNETGRIASTLGLLKNSLIEADAAERQRLELQQQRETERAEAERAKEAAARAQDQERVAAEAARKEAEAAALAREQALVVNSFGEGLAALAQNQLDFRLRQDLPAAYRKLQSDFNSAIAGFEQSQRDAEAARNAREQDREQAELARKQAEEQALAREQALVVSSFGQGLAALAKRNIAFRLDHELPPAYRQLKADFNAAMAQIEDALRTIDTQSNDMASGAGDISRAADDLARRTEQQAASLEETAAAVDQVTATVAKTADNARQANVSVADARREAAASDEIVRQAVDAMREIDASARQISQIIGVIDEIAFQTNLLALNAGVEAARAGDAGRGFAVVASEVRALAQRSADAAKEIKALISTSDEQVKAGVRLVGATGEALSRIVQCVSEMNGLVVDIAASAQEQAAALGEVNTAVNQMDQTTQQNAAMVEESTAASHTLAQQARDLSALVAQFALGGVKAGGGASSEGRPVRLAARRRAASGPVAAAAVQPDWEEF